MALARRGIQQAQVAVDLGRGAFDDRHRPDEGAPGAQPRDGEIQHRALGLRAVQSAWAGTLHFAQRICARPANPGLYRSSFNAPGSK